MGGDRQENGGVKESPRGSVLDVGNVDTVAAASRTAGDTEFFRASELATRFGVFSRSTWNLFLQRGDLPSKKFGRARVVRHADVIAFLSVGAWQRI
jgi:hypothetical protein